MQVKLASEISADDEVVKRLQLKMDLFQKQIEQGLSPIPGSEDDLIMQELALSMQGLKNRKSRNENTLARIGEAFSSSDPMTDIRNQAWSIMMTANMEKDFKTAALRYSDISKKVGFKVDEQAKMKQKFIYDKMLKEYEAKLKKAKDQVEQNLSPSLQTGESVAIINDPVSGRIVAVNPEKLDEVSPVEVNTAVFENEDSKINELKANYVAAALVTNNFILEDKLKDLGFTDK